MWAADPEAPAAWTVSYSTLLYIPMCPALSMTAALTTVLQFPATHTPAAPIMYICVTIMHIFLYTEGVKVTIAEFRRELFKLVDKGHRRRDSGVWAPRQIDPAGGAWTSVLSIGQADAPASHEQRDDRERAPGD